VPELQHNGLEIHYETFGEAGNPCVLLIMGLGTQMTAWPLSLINELVEKGYFVVRYDNRDVGLSTRLDHLKPPNLRKLIFLRLLGIRSRVPYSLEDMAGDAIAVLDALKVNKAAIVGASMGGMIAQLVAALYPERTTSLTSIMSTTGHRSLPRAEPAAMAALMLQPEDPDDLNSVLERNKKVRRTLQSPGYPMSDERLHETVSNALERGGYHPEGVARHLGAIVTANHRRDLLKKVKAPALVLHGEDDPLVKLGCGVDTHKHLPNSELKTYPGMGHDLPEELMPEWASLIDETTRRVS
jgi:pimeloyl-ACP methyl ester carboxylesterase